MKKLGIMLVGLMLMAGPASAVVIFEEDFTGTTGEAIHTLGWGMYGTVPILISDQTIDEGQSGEVQSDWSGDCWYIAPFGGYTLTGDEYFRLSLVGQAKTDFFALMNAGDGGTLVLDLSGCLFDFLLLLVKLLLTALEVSPHLG